MSLSTKILIWLAAILLLAGLIFIGVKQWEIGERQKAIQTEQVNQKQLANDIIRAQERYATKESIEALAKANGVDLHTIHDDLAKLDARVDGINAVAVNSKGENDTNVKSTSTVPNADTGTPPVQCRDGKCPDTYGYLQNTQELKLDEKFGTAIVPIGSVGFSSWRAAPWDVVVYPRKYSLTTVTGKDADGKEYVYNKFAVTTNGEKHDIKIDDSTFLQEYPSPTFSWFNPRLYMGISGGLGIQTHNADFVPSLSLALMSYGQRKDLPAWTFVNLGLGYAAVNKKLTVMITPFTYNVGQHLTLVRNIFLGPTLGVDNAATFYGLIMLNVGL